MAKDEEELEEESEAQEDGKISEEDEDSEDDSDGKDDLAEEDEESDADSSDDDPDDEMVEVDVTEISLSGEEIDELIDKLRELKKTRESVEFELDEENDLVINYTEDD